MMRHIYKRYDTLDFSPYQDLEIITISGQATGSIFKNVEYVKGEIRKINVSRNKNLKELIMPNQELEGILNLSANSELEKINIANNFLNELRVHSKFSQKLKGINSNYLQPQKHNKDRIHPIKNVSVILLDMSGTQKNKQNEVEFAEKIRNLQEAKSKEILQLKSKLEAKLENEWQASFLETLLISQEQIVRLEGADRQIIAVSERELQKAEKKLKDKLTEEEIRKICQIKVELTNLEMELETLLEKETETKIEINYPSKI